MPASLLFAIKASLALTVFGLGLRATPGDVIYLLRRPRLLVRTVLAMNLVTPLVVLMVALGFRVDHAITLGLVAVALSPIPPLLPVNALNPSGEGSYANGAMLAASLVAIVTVPTAVRVMSDLLGVPMQVREATIARIVILGVVFPFAIGVLVQRMAPAWSDGAHDLVASLAGVMLLVGMIPLVAYSWAAMIGLLTSVTFIAILAGTVACTVVGHVLGGPDAEHRTILGLATSWHHPAVALVIVKHVYPGDRHAIASVLLVLGAGAAASLFYRLWRHARSPVALAGR